MEKYDENLQENPFFEGILRLFPTLYADAPLHQWTICIPRLGTTQRENVREDDYKCHILQMLESMENGATLYTTLNSQAFRIRGKEILPDEEDSKDEVPIHILFEEVFYNAIGDSFKVLCLDRPLLGSVEPMDVQLLHSLPQCVSFLKQEKCFRHVDDLLKKFERSFAISKKTFTFEQLKETTETLYNQALRNVFRDRCFKRKASLDKVLMENLHLAIETYLMNGIYPVLMRNLRNAFAVADSALNKRARNLVDIQPRDLDIPSKLCEAIASAKLEFCRLPCLTTRLGKLHCLKRTFDTLQTKLAVTADDCLSVITLLVIRSGFPNWVAQLNFMKYFCLSPHSGNDIGEQGFHLVTLEAAIELINSGNLKTGHSDGLLFMEESFSSSENMCPLFPTDVDVAASRTFFEVMKTGDTSLLEKWPSKVALASDVGVSATLCHPLCICEKCVKKQQLLMSVGKPISFLRDQHGRTALHLAVLNNHANVIEVLMHQEADVNAVDQSGATPLHLACQHGLHNIALLLLHFEANATIQDIDGNTPLHFAADRGQDRCVKTLLYCDECMATEMNVNVVNEHGDTSLHFAARWGYIEIIQLLLQFGALIDIYNKKQETPLDLAHSSSVTNSLQNTKAKGRKFRPWKHKKLAKSLSMSELPVYSVSFYTEDTIVAISERPATLSSGELPNPTELSGNRKVEKLLRAVARNDLKLVSFYLGVAGDELDETIDAELPKSLCHPLCQCERCGPLQKIKMTP